MIDLALLRALGVDPAIQNAGGVVESELDAVLISQEAGDLVTAIALGTARGKPDEATTALLRAAPVILVALDFDEAGKAGWPWWKETFRASVLWPVPVGKDVGDLLGIPGLIGHGSRRGCPLHSRPDRPKQRIASFWRCRLSRHSPLPSLHKVPLRPSNPPDQPGPYAPPATRTRAGSEESEGGVSWLAMETIIGWGVFADSPVYFDLLGVIGGSSRQEGYA